MTDAQATSRAPESDLRLISAIIYGLYLFAFCNGITALVAVVIAYVKRSDARGTLYESHFSNAITIFWAAFAACTLLIVIGIQAALSFALFREDGLAHFVNTHIYWLMGAAPIVWIAGSLFCVWLLYRVLRGLVLVLENRPY